MGEEAEEGRNSREGECNDVQYKRLCHPFDDDLRDLDGKVVTDEIADTLGIDEQN